MQLFAKRSGSTGRFFFLFPEKKQNQSSIRLKGTVEEYGVITPSSIQVPNNSKYSKTGYTTLKDLFVYLRLCSNPVSTDTVKYSVMVISTSPSPEDFCLLRVILLESMFCVFSFEGLLSTPDYTSCINVFTTCPKQMSLSYCCSLRHRRNA